MIAVNRAQVAAVVVEEVDTETIMAAVDIVPVVVAVAVAVVLIVNKRATSVEIVQIVVDNREAMADTAVVVEAAAVTSHVTIVAEKAISRVIVPNHARNVLVLVSIAMKPATLPHNAQTIIESDNMRTL